MPNFLATAPDVRFVAEHEGFASKAYRCPAGVVTIGFGFTMGSKVFADWWRAKHGRALRMGDTITRADANTILRALMNEEYGAAVNSQVRPTKQHQWGGATSVAFNAGKGALKWKWAQALAAGRVSEAARLLRTTAVTANGRRLPGLVRRRRDEADLIEHGRYTSQTSVDASADRVAKRASIRQWQQWLRDLGFYKGEVDGLVGPQTIAAVRAFQKKHGLKVDGVVGSATLSTIIREKDRKAGNKAGGGTTAGGVVATAVESVSQGGMPSVTVAILAVCAVVAVLGGIWWWRNRGRVTGKRVAVA